MRGKQTPVDFFPISFRITPAGAGKTRQELLNIKIKRDHPRRCGENDFEKANCESTNGSPPQVRGKLKQSLYPASACRITPAGAGKTTSHFSHTSLLQDHPRRCGENVSYFHRFLSFLGSPPQVRGKQLQLFPRKPGCRITPAGAGKTVTACLPPRVSQDHPRRCGENIGTEAGYSAMIGSPPQVRGKRRPRSRLYPRARITPAGAGKTRVAEQHKNGN